MYSGPHQRSSGNRFASRKFTIMRRLRDQVSQGPIGLLDQSKERIRAPISPPPERNSALSFGADAVSALAVGRVLRIVFLFGPRTLDLSQETGPSVFSERLGGSSTILTRCA